MLLQERSGFYSDTEWARTKWWNAWGNATKRAGIVRRATDATSSTRILVVVDAVAAGGGTEQLLLTLLPRLQAQGYKVEVVALFDQAPSLTLDFGSRGIRIHHLHANGPFSLLRGILGLRRLLRRSSYGILWSHSRVSSIVTRLASFGTDPVQVVTLHSEGFAQRKDLPLRSKITTRFERILLSRPKKIAVSKAVADDHARFFGWPDIDVIYNCFDQINLPSSLSVAERAELRILHRIEPDDCALVMPARFVAKKGHKVLVKALAILSVTKGWKPVVLCFGHGDLKNEVIRDAEAHDVRIRVAGLLPQRELFRVVKAMDGVVLPSLREPFGIAALEAMVLGAPLIVSDVDGLSEIMGNDPCALKIPPNDPDALANAIWQLMSDAEGNNKRRASALEVAQRYHPDEAVRRWSELFLSLARRRPPTPAPR